MIYLKNYSDQINKDRALKFLLGKFNVKEIINTTNFKNCVGINNQRQGVDKMVENKFYNVEFHSMFQDLFY
jgi:hypothetical protein